MRRGECRNIRVVIVCFAVQCALQVGAISAAEDGEYDVSKIPNGLRKDGTAAVVRKDVGRFEVKSPRHTVLHCLRAVTIFEKEKESYGDIELRYDKFIEIESLEGRIYDASGKKIRELDSDDIKDMSAIGDYSLYDDIRKKTAHLYYNRYPYTVEYQYEISYDGVLNWPTWYSRGSFDPVELSRYEVLLPSGQNLSYHCKGDSTLPVISSDGHTKHYVWQSTNLPELPEDAYGKDIDDIATVIRIAPAAFELEGHTGSMKSWRDFGAWYYSLTEGRNNLPENALQDLRSLMIREDSISESIAKIYRYMQSRTRYVSVQLGIGGWQPFDAQIRARTGVRRLQGFIKLHRFHFSEPPGLKPTLYSLRLGATLIPCSPIFPAINSIMSSSASRVLRIPCGLSARVNRSRPGI